MGEIENKTKRGLAWRSLEGFGLQATQLIIQFVLARILLPEDFGILNILNVFTNLANTFVMSGLSNALIQKKDADQIDYNTVYYIENGIAIIMYILIFIGAPFVSAYYGNPDLTLYLRVFSLVVLFGAQSSIQTTKLRKDMDFKSSFIANSIGILAYGSSGIVLAVKGFGVWSLVISQIIYRAVVFILLIHRAKWIPGFLFSLQRLKKLFSYSWKLFVGWLIGTLYQDAFSLIIGKVYDTATLGYYSKGNSIPTAVNRTITQITTAVMFPAISKIQEKKEKVKSQTRMMLSISAALVFPVMAGIAAVAKPLVVTLLTDKWLMAVPVIQIMSIPAAINVINNANMQSFNAIGRSDFFLYSEMIKRSITIVIVIVLAKVNFYLMLFSIVFMGLISLSINSFFNRKYLNYSNKEQIVDILPYIIYAAVFFMVIYVIQFLNLSYKITFAVQIISCVLLYGVSVWFIKLRAFQLLKKTIQSFIQHRHL